MTATDAIGLDIGGSTLKAVRIGADGAIVRRATTAAGGGLAREALLAVIDKTIAEIGGLDGVSRVGIAVGGLVRRDGTMPAGATNLPNLAETPLAALFGQRFARPCHVLNDAQAAMHGEAWCGAARGLSHVLMVTFGTGIGGGLLLDGRVRAGAHGSAGEIGAWPVADAGGTAMLEAFISPVRFARRSGRGLAEALLRADQDVEGAAALAAVGRALASAHLLLDLDAILLGGGITAAGEPLRAAIDGAVRQACPPAFHHGLIVGLAALGSYAGAMGAVAPSAARAQA